MARFSRVDITSANLKLTSNATYLYSYTLAIIVCYSLVQVRTPSSTGKYVYCTLACPTENKPAKTVPRRDPTSHLSIVLKGSHETSHVLYRYIMGLHFKYRHTPTCPKTSNRATWSRKSLPELTMFLDLRSSLAFSLHETLCLFCFSKREFVFCPSFFPPLRT